MIWLGDSAALPFPAVGVGETAGDEA